MFAANAISLYASISLNLVVCTSAKLLRLSRIYLNSDSAFSSTSLCISFSSSNSLLFSVVMLIDLNLWYVLVALPLKPSITLLTSSALISPTWFKQMMMLVVAMMHVQCFDDSCDAMFSWTNETKTKSSYHHSLNKIGHSTPNRKKLSIPCIQEWISLLWPELYPFHSSQN